VQLTVPASHLETPVPAGHRSLSRLLLGQGLLTALVIALFSIYCQPARAEGYVEVLGLGPGALYSHPFELSGPGSSPPDVTNQTYSVVTALGSRPTSVTVTDGYTMDTVLSALGYLTPPFGSAEIQGPQGHGSMLSYAEATSTGVPHAPVFWNDAGGLHFADGNPADYITKAGAGNGITIYLHAGPVLTVTASTTTTGKIAAGTPVHFKLDAPVTGQAAGESLRYEWIFDDGATSSRSSITHKYPVAGTYDAHLRVAGGDDSLGFSSVIPITVGQASKGPDRNGGGSNSKTKAPTSGAGVKGSGDRRGTAKQSAGTSPTTAGTTTTPSTTTTASATTTVTSTAAATTTTTNHTPTATARHSPTVKRAPRPTGPLVSGIALTADHVKAGAVAPDTSAPGVADPARTGHLTSPGRGLGEGFWIALATAVALLVGALLEAYRPLRRPRLPRFRGGLPRLR
jgi:hypothetical protein